MGGEGRGGGWLAIKGRLSFFQSGKAAQK